MSVPDTTPIWRPLPTKLRAYEAVYWLNRSFEATLLSLERLERLGMFRLEYLNEYKVRLEHTRAQTKRETDRHFARVRDGRGRPFRPHGARMGKQRRDPDEVFFHARDRKQEIKEQIRELQKGLQRQRPRHTTRKKRVRK